MKNYGRLALFSLLFLLITSCSNTLETPSLETAATSSNFVACLNASCSSSVALDKAALTQTSFGIRWKGSASYVEFVVDGGAVYRENIGPFDAYGSDDSNNGSIFKTHTQGAHTASAKVNGGTTYTASFTVTSASNCTFFVATNGKDINAGTEIAPFKTMNKGIAGLRPGNTLCVRAGTYPALAIRGKNGTLSQRITIKGYGSEKPKLDRSTMPEPSNCKVGDEAECAVLLIENSSYLTIDGFEITDSDDLIKGERVYQLDLRQDLNNPDNDSSDLKAVKARLSFSGVVGRGVNEEITIRNNNIHHIWRVGVDGNFDNSFLQNNEIHHIGGYGTYLRGTGTSIEGNRVHHTASHGIRVGLEPNPFNDGKFKNGVIARNEIYEVGLGDLYHATSKPNPEILNGAAGIIVWHGIGNEIYYNSVRNSYGDGSDYHEYEGTGVFVKGCSNKVLHNTVTKNERWGLVFAEDGSECSKLANESIANIYYANGKSTKMRPIDKTKQDIIKDPLFVNAAANNFQLKANSPAINFEETTTPAASRSTDIRGKAISGRPDAGAYEY